MDVVFDWNLGNMIYNGHNTLRLCGFSFAEIRSFHLWSTSRRPCEMELPREIFLLYFRHIYVITLSYA